MQWRRPQRGDVRTRRLFAFLPIDCDDGTTIWLERYWVRETYGQKTWAGGVYDRQCWKTMEISVLPFEQPKD